MNRSFLVAVPLIAAGFCVVVWFAVPGVPMVPVVIVASGVVVLFLLFWYFGSYLPTRRFIPLMQRFGFAEVPGDPEAIAGAWGGRKALLRYHPASKQRPAPRLEIHLYHDVGTVPETVFRRENFLHRLIKTIGLSKENQAGDRIFDPKIYVESENDAAVQPLLEREDARLQVLALLEIPQTMVVVDGEGAGIVIRGHLGWTKYFNPDKIQEILDRLSTLANVVAEISRSGPPVAAPPSAVDFSAGCTLSERLKLLRHPARLAIFTAALSMFAGPALFFWGTRYQPVTWRLHLIGFALAGVCLLVFVPLAFSIARGGSRSHQIFFTFLIAAAAGFPTFWIGGLKVVNGFFDGGPPVVVEARMVRRQSKGRLQLLVEHQGESRPVSVAAPPELYGKFTPGQPIPLLLSPGVFDEPWVVGLR